MEGTIITLLIALLAGMASFVTPPGLSSERGNVTVGSRPLTADQHAPAPDLELQGLDGRRFRLRDLRGRVVVLNFWATWCAPCRVEIPELNRLQVELEKRGLSVVGLSWDDSSEKVKRFEKEIELQYKVVLGGEKVQERFGGVPGLPTTFIIDRKGRIRQKVVGPRDGAGFRAAILPLLDE